MTSDAPGKSVRYPAKADPTDIGKRIERMIAAVRQGRTVPPFVADFANGEGVIITVRSRGDR